MSDPPVEIEGDAIVLEERIIGPPPSHIIETDVRGDLSLYDAKQERVLVLNGSATDVWLLCDGEQTVGRIVELLSTAYGVAAAAIRDDVEKTLRLFIAEGFLPRP